MALTKAEEKESQYCYGCKELKTRRDFYGKYSRYCRECNKAYMRRRYKDRKEKGLCPYCGKKNTWSRSICKACTKRYIGSGLKRLLYSAKSRSKRQGLEFSISEADLEFVKVCPVLGIKLKINTGKRGPSDSSPTLARIDHTKGYVPGNVVIMSWRANKIMERGSLGELKAIVRFLENFKDKK